MTVQLNIDLHESLTAKEVDNFHAKCRAMKAAPESVLAELIRGFAEGTEEAA